MLSIILWSVVGILQLISMLAGTPAPTWTQYWCVFVIMMLNIILNRILKEN